MGFWLRHDTPEDGSNGGSTGGDGDGKGSGMPKLGTFTFSAGFKLPEKVCAKPVCAGLEIARETASGKLSWATGVKCVETGTQAGFDSDFNLTLATPKKWGDNLTMTNWFSVPMTKLASGGNFGNIKNWLRWGMHMSIDS